MDLKEKLKGYQRSSIALDIVNNPTQSSALDGAWERRSIH